MEEKKDGVKKTFTVGVTHLKNDSMILAELLYKVGDYGVLKEYVGKAAFIFYDLFYKDTLFAFRGESMISESSTVATEERPLYYYRMNNNSMYLSSQREGLFSIGGDGKTVDMIPANTVIKIIGNRITPVVHVDRSNVMQTEPIPRSKYYGNKRWNDDYEYGYGSNYGHNFGSSGFNSFLDETFPDLYVHPSLNDAYKLIYWKGGYHIYKKGEKDAVIAHGIYTTNSFGIVSKQENDKGVTTIYHNPGFSKLFAYNLYFIQGMLIKGKLEYEQALTALQSHLKITRLKEGKYHNAFDSNKFFKILSYYSVYPTVCTQRGEVENVYFAMGGFIDSTYTGTYYTGTFSPIFTDRVYQVNVGTLTGVHKASLPGYRKTITDIPEGANEKRYFIRAEEKDNDKSLVPAVIKGGNSKVIAMHRSIKKGKESGMVVVINASKVAKEMLKVPYSLCGVCTEAESDACSHCFINTGKEYGDGAIMLPTAFAELNWDLETVGEFYWKNKEFYKKNRKMMDDVLELARGNLSESNATHTTLNDEEIEATKEEIKRLGTSIDDSIYKLSLINNDVFIDSFADRLLRISDEVEQMLIDIGEVNKDSDFLSGEVYTGPHGDNIEDAETI